MKVGRASASFMIIEIASQATSLPPMEHENNIELPNCCTAQTHTHEAAPRVISLTGLSAALLIEADLISSRSVLERRLEELASAKTGCLENQLPRDRGVALMCPRRDSQAYPSSFQSLISR